MNRPPNDRYRRKVLNLVSSLMSPGLLLPAMATRPSCSSSSTAINDNPAPPMSIRCVGPQSVTSWPKMRCQMSSSGKPISAYRPHSAMSTPPTGAYQVRVIRIAAGPGFS